MTEEDIIIDAMKAKGYEVVMKSGYESDQWFVEFVNSEHSVYALHRDRREAVRNAAARVKEKP